MRNHSKCFLTVNYTALTRLTGFKKKKKQEFVVMENCYFKKSFFHSVSDGDIDL